MKSRQDEMDALMLWDGLAELDVAKQFGQFLAIWERTINKVGPDKGFMARKGSAYVLATPLNGMELLTVCFDFHLFSSLFILFSD